MSLHLEPEQLTTCVACGLCLPHCPTFRATGEEARSPRGRIDAMRAVQWRGAPIDDDFVEIIETCVQCRGCEPACPSGVPFGRLIEGDHGEELARRAHASRRAGSDSAFSMLPRHRLLLAGSTLLAVAQRLRLAPRRLGVGPAPAAARRPAVDAHRLRRLAVHRVRDGRVAARDPSQHGAGARRPGRHVRRSRRDVGVVLWRAAHARRTPRRGRGAGAATSWRRCPATRRSSSTRPAAARRSRTTATCSAPTARGAFAARVFDVHEWIAPRLDVLPALRARSASR